MKNEKIWKGALIVIGIIAIIGLFTPVGKLVSNYLSGVTSYDEVDATAIKIGGTNGSRVGPIISTTCTLLANFSIAATTTRNVPCAVTGVVSGDAVTIELSTTTPSWGAFVVVGAQASTTSGQIDVTIANYSGAAIVPTSIQYFGSTTNVTVLHPVTSVPSL